MNKQNKKFSILGNICIFISFTGIVALVGIGLGLGLKYGLDKRYKKTELEHQEHIKTMTVAPIDKVEHIYGA